TSPRPWVCRSEPGISETAPGSAPPRGNPRPVPPPQGSPSPREKVSTTNGWERVAWRLMDEAFREDVGSIAPYFFRSAPHYRRHPIYGLKIQGPGTQRGSSYRAG